MSLIKNAIALMEVECAEKLPKGPKGEPKPGGATPIEMSRVLASVSKKREQLDKRIKQLGAAQTKASKKKSDSANAKVVCAKMRVKIAKDYLDWTIKRWKIMSAVAKEKLKTPQGAAHADKINAYLSFGAKLAGDATLHSGQYDDEGGSTGALAPGAIIKLKYDFKKNKLLGPGGEEFSIEKAAKAAPEPSVSAVVPTTPVVKKPKVVADLSSVEKAALFAKMKAKAVEAIIQHGYIAPELIDGVFDDAGLLFSIKFHDKVMDTIEFDLSVEGHLGAITNVANDVVANNIGKDTVELASMLVKSIAKTSGKLLPSSAAFDVIQSAQEKLALPMKFDDYTAADQTKIKGIVKMVGIQNSAVETGQLVGLIQNALAKEDLSISNNTISVIALEMSKFVLKPGDGLSALPPSAMQAAIVVAKQAVKVDKNPTQAVLNAGIASLSIKAAQELAKVVGSGPDEAGFLSEITEIYKKATLAELKMNGLAWTSAVVKGGLSGLLKKYALEPSAVEGLKSKYDAIRMAERKSRWKPDKAKTAMFSAWDKLSKTVSMSPMGGVAAGMTALNDNAEAIGWPGSVGWKKITGNKGKLTGQTFIKPLFNEWYSAWKKDKDLEAEKAKPKIDAAPPPPAKPTPQSYLYSPTGNELSSDINFMKVDGYWKMSQSQRKWMDGQIRYHFGMGHLTNTDNSLNETAAKKLFSKLRKNLKEMWAPAGMKSVGIKFIQMRIKSEHENWKAKEKAWASKSSVSVAPATTAKSEQQTALDDWHAVKNSHVAFGAALNDWQIANIGEIADKIEAGQSTPARLKQLQKATAAIVAYLAKQADNAQPAPSSTPAVQPQVTATTVEFSPLQMTPVELAAFFSLERPHTAPAQPKGKSKAWKSAASMGVDGMHAKKIAPTGEDPNEPGTTHLWMMKDAGPDGFIMAAEVAANRVQTLLGLGSTEHVWLDKTGWRGNPAVVQHFKAQDSYRKKGQKSPWMDDEDVAKEMQKYHLLNWLIDDKDDHDGNFVIDPATDKISCVDHGQSFKFFDSKNTLLKDMDWEPPSSAYQDPGKGFPKKMLRDFAAGKNVNLMALDNPEFEDIIARAESIPSNVYKDAFRQYAEGSVKQTGKVAIYSKTKKDKTSEGFLTGLDARRTGLRAQVGDLYASLIKQRAASLAKIKGGSKDKIEKALKAAMGLDEFLQGKPVTPKEPDAEIIKMAIDWSTQPGWDESKLPSTSHLPTSAKIAESGVLGVSMQMHSTDVKGGQASFFQIGDVPFLAFHLEPGARAKLQSRLPGMSTEMAEQPPIKPTPLAHPAFVPPEKEILPGSSSAVHADFLGVAGVSSFQKPDGTPATKIEKYLGKWAKKIGEGSPGGHHLRKAYDWAVNAAKSKDPVTKAAGNYYKDALNKIGTPAPSPVGFAFKDVDTVPEEDRTIAPFVPTDKMKTDQDKAQAKLNAAHGDKVKAAKTQWEANKAESESEHKGLIDLYEKKLATYNEKMAAKDMLPATKLDDFPVPANPVYAGFASSAHGKGKNIAGDASSEWDGNYMGWSNKPHTHGGTPFKHTTYEFDLSDAISSLAAVSGAAKSKLLVHYVPEATAGHRKNPGRGGLVRVQFPAGSSKELMRQAMKAVNATLGIDARPASKGEQELTYLRRMAWHRHFEGEGIGDFQSIEDGKLGQEATTKERVDFWIKKFSTKPKKKGKYKSKGVGFDPRFEPEWEGTLGLREPKLDAKGKVVYQKTAGGKKKPNPNYQPEVVDMGAGMQQFKRFDISDADFKKIANDVGHNNTHDAGKGTVGNLMTMMASGWRALIGMGHVGTSATSDLRSGGSNSIFTYTNGQGTTIQLDPRFMQFTGTYSHKDDKFGSKVSYSHSGGKTRDASLQEDDLYEAFGALGITTGETMIPERMDLVRWATKVRVGSDTRVKAIIKALEKKGITAIGPDNKPVAEVIVK